MWPDRVSSPGPLTYKSGALPIAQCVPAAFGLLTYELSDLDLLLVQEFLSDYPKVLKY